MNILIVDFEFPESDRSSGGHRLYNIIEILKEAGHNLAFVSIDYWLLWKKQDEVYPAKLRALGIDTFRDGQSISPEGGQFIQQFDPDVTILSKYYIANMLIPYMRQMHPMCKLILDTVDVHFLRERRAHKKNWQQTMHIEIAATMAVDRVWAITEPDKKELKRHTSKSHRLDCHIVPNIHNVVGPGLPLRLRKSIVFVGNYVHEPNVDAIHYMAEDILPELRKRGCHETFLAVGPYENLLPDFEGVIKTGYVEDLDTLLQGAKVGIAPLRYGAGMKGKIGSYMCNGLPVVTTAIGAEGMELVNSQTALIREHHTDFADAIALLCGEGAGEGVWKHLSKVALKKVTQWSSVAQKKVIYEAVLFD